MKHVKLFLLFVTIMVAVAVGGHGQQSPPQDELVERDEQQQARRPNLLAELGLSPEQVQQIRRVNQGRRPAMINARRRMGDAARNLDVAIYGDVVSEEEVQTRLKEFQAAEADLSRLRFEGELLVRKILTPEQLLRFRELRRRFAEERRKNNTDRRIQRREQAPFRRPVN